MCECVHVHVRVCDAGRTRVPPCPLCRLCDDDRLGSVIESDRIRQTKKKKQINWSAGGVSHRLTQPKTNWPGLGSWFSTTDWRTANQTPSIVRGTNCPSGERVLRPPSRKLNEQQRSKVGRVFGGGLGSAGDISLPLSFAPCGSNRQPTPSSRPSPLKWSAAQQQHSSASRVRGERLLSVTRPLTPQQQPQQPSTHPRRPAGCCRSSSLPSSSPALDSNTSLTPPFVHRITLVW